MSDSGDDEDQVVPGNVVNDLDLPVEEAELPENDDVIMEDDEEVEEIYVNQLLGEVRPIQLANQDGQGLYFTARTGAYGYVLIKNLEGGFQSRLQEIYRNLDIPPEGLANIAWAEDRARRREIKFVSELIHPNIAKVLAFISPTGRREDIKALVMEGAADGVLENYARRHPFPDADVKALGLQLASALQYCHDEGVMHRDVRPRNIYVHDGGRTLKLGNFGYARRGGPVLVTANRGEELWYKAPEVISSGPLAAYGYSVDVYSVALVLWSMSHGGRRPFIDEGVQVYSDTVFKQYLEEEDDHGEELHRPIIRADLDAGLATLIRRCWVTENGLRTRPAMTEVVTKLTVIPHSLPLV